MHRIRKASIALTIIMLSASIANAAGNVNSIASFIACLNMLNQQNGSIVDAVRCIPSGCQFTLTMSPKSAQAACTLGGCQLPRVILNCAGPAAGKRFRPSFLLCPKNSKGADGNVFGTDRVELGEDLQAVADSTMKMADVPIPAGTNLNQITEDGAVSKIQAPADDEGGTKGCNNGCHTRDNPPNAMVGDPDLSKPIDPFGMFGSTNLAPFIIDTNEPGRRANPHMRENICDVCRCIMANQQSIRNDPNNDNANLNTQVLLNLCTALSRKLGFRHCDVAPTPTPTPTPGP